MNLPIPVMTVISSPPWPSLAWMTLTVTLTGIEIVGIKATNEK